MTQQQNRVCPPSALGFLNSPLRRLVQPVGRLKRLVEPGMKVLDIGCGGGFFSALLAKWVGPEGRVIAVDLQREMLEITRGYLAKRSLLERATLHQCTAESLELEREQIAADLALAMYVVHEVPDRGKLLLELAEALKPGGKLVLVEPRGHVKRPEWESTLKDARAAGFSLGAPLGDLFSFGRQLVRSS